MLFLWDLGVSEGSGINIGHPLSFSGFWDLEYTIVYTFTLLSLDTLFTCLIRTILCVTSTLSIATLAH